MQTYFYSKGNQLGSETRIMSQYKNYLKEGEKLEVEGGGVLIISLTSVRNQYTLSRNNYTA